MAYLMTMTPHFTIRVWGDTGQPSPQRHYFWPPPPREALCEIEVDTTTCGGALDIVRHRGLELIAQKMLTR